jgi:hypothetical protein
MNNYLNRTWQIAGTLAALLLCVGPVDATASGQAAVAVVTLSKADEIAKVRRIGALGNLVGTPAQTSGVRHGVVRGAKQATCFPAT